MSAEAIEILPGGPTDGPLEEQSVLAVPQPTPAPSLTRSLAGGVFSLGGSLAIERGAGFVSNLLAGRFAGAAVFGAYSISINTANNIASYAGAGIGTTATRFIADHPEGSPAREQVLRALMLFSVVSSSLAALLLWFAAEPLANSFLHNPALITPLKIAALSAAGFVALECCRGIFIGTREFAPLLLLSVLVGAGSLIAIPAMARFGPSFMVGGQAAAVFTATLISMVALLVRRLWQKEKRSASIPGRVSLWEIWRFGLVQLGGVVGLNAAGWWTASLVARADRSLLAMAFYTVASQWRNLCALLPNMVQQGNFAFFTDQGASKYGGAMRVLNVSSIFSSILAILCSAIVIVAAPFAIRHTYGQGYAAAELPTGFAIATVLVHIGMSPASSRLTVVSLRWTAIINGIWSAAVVIAGTFLIPIGGPTAATATLFAAHVLSVILVLFALWKMDALPAGLVTFAALDVAAAVAFCGLAVLRTTHPQQALTADGALLLVATVGALLLVRFGRRHGVLPETTDWLGLARAGWMSLCGQIARFKKPGGCPEIA